MPSVRCSFSAFVLFCFAMAAGRAADASPPALPGALELVEAWRRAADQPAPDAPRGLRAALADYQARAPRLAPAEAAAQWLGLVERFTTLGGPGRMQESSAYGESLGFADVLAALPPVAAWNDLSRAIAQRGAAIDPRELALRLLAARLAGDAAAEETARTALLQRAKDAAPDGGEREPNNPLGENEGTSQVMLAAFTSELERRERGGRALGFLLVPDLVTIVGRDAARALLRRALVLPDANVHFATGRETKSLAREVALEAMAEVTSPAWGVAAQPGSLALFEASEKKFGAPSARASRDEDFTAANKHALYQQARAYYVLDLVAAGRTDEAARVALAVFERSEQEQAWVNGALRALDDFGHEDAVAEFFARLLARHPTLPVWGSYLAIAAKAGRSAEALRVLETAVAAPALTPELRERLKEHLAAALLAADRVDEGVAELRSALQNDLARDASGAPVDPYRFGERVQRLLWLGALLEQPAWIDEALGVLRRRLDADPAGVARVVPELAYALAESRRLPDAVQLLDAAVRRTAALRSRADDREEIGATRQQLLVMLAEMYHRAGRPREVLALFDAAPDWQVADVAGIENVSLGFHGKEGVRPLYLAAAALARTGRPVEAQAALDVLFHREGGYDPAYALLLEISGPAAGAKLEALAQRDRFEERPLLWLAELRRREGRLEEAEKLARAAIAIDPSDGEQPRGDRMRVYAVLAEIRAARGDAPQAEFFRGVVRAIRAAEDADRLHAAGLLTRAITRYTQALTHFADAYCIQSRLAVQLHDAGRFAEAEEHYRRAYELMPDSFGRVESHCFGCERAFGAPRAQSVAERVFTALVEKTPEKPQVHYLLGYLRDEQGRANEALPHFRRAVALDPDYLNAWKKIGELGGDMHLAPADREAAALNVLRLDPLRRHGNANVAHVRDLRALFSQLEAARAAFPPAPTSVYPLQASREPAHARPGAPHWSNGSGPMSTAEVAREQPLLVTVAAIFDRER